MTPVRPAFVPDASLSREEMESLQRTIAETAVFDDDLSFAPESVRLEANSTLDASVSGESPVVVGVDQSFLDDRAISALVAMRDGEVVERVHAVTALDIPYIPGLLSFREGRPILAAFEQLASDPDLVVFDGSGRIHFRQAGIATHLGVVLDVPSVGVAKSLLCGTPDDPTENRPTGWRTPIRVAEGDQVDAPVGAVLGYAYQSKQWERAQSINPLYVSPGHRVSAETTVELVERLCGGYKLPEPTRLADAYADEVKAGFD
jgi:deoxyribonuclease V